MKSLTSKASTRRKSVLARLAVIASLSLAANASIVYFNPADITASSAGGQTIYIDVNGGQAGYTSFGQANDLLAFFQGNQLLFDLPNDLHSENLCWMFGGPLALSYGAQIAPFSGVNYQWDMAHFADPGPWSFPSPHTGYLGFRFDPTGGMSLNNYGWAHYTYDQNAHTITLLDFAYQTTPGVGTFAGEGGPGGGPSSVPEPGTLALAALGVTGLVAVRIRRNKKAAAA